ncbi:MAG TPA: response regulator transcription factor [Solirubrobacteraceae bacterium]|nr:response regulator transcription factor [Solirubrobacteraceae bacterium]
MSLGPHVQGASIAAGRMPAPVDGGLRGRRVAVADRDGGFVEVLTKRLERIGAERVLLERVPSPEQLGAMRLSALVVDLALAGAHAWDWLEAVSARYPALGLVVCTAQASVAQRVRGLRAGADDWIAKPCHPEEVIARIEAIARRREGHRAAREEQALKDGELEIRPDRFQAYVRSRSLDLTRREFELIALLAGAQGRVLEREEIYARLWGYVMVRGDRSVDVFVRKLRQKLRAASPGWRYIHTHFGIGYRFAAEPLADFQASSPPRGDAAGARAPADEVVDALADPDAVGSPALVS